MQQDFSLNLNYKWPKKSYNKESDSPAELGTLFDKKIWRINDVAKFLGCSKGHIYNLVSDEKIPKVKKGKFLYFIPDVIHNWILEGNLQ